MNITWNAADYSKNFSFVHEYGEDVLNLIRSPAGSFAADLGCGGGDLTAKLAEKGFRVAGIDSSNEMLSLARQNHPGIRFIQSDALDFSLPQGELADVVFSNAVFHWIDGEKQAALLSNINKNLKAGGELVAEFGGAGCAQKVHSALNQAFAARSLVYPRVFFFPTIGEYAPLLERAGFRVEYAVLFDRPTPQKGQDGLADWIRMFVKKPFEGLEIETKDAILADVVKTLKPTLYRGGTWFIDYVRLRFRAVKR